MWWSRILNRSTGVVPRGTARFLERVISPSESHSSVPFRVFKEAPAVKSVIASLEPTVGANYRIKRDKPDPLKQCF